MCVSKTRLTQARVCDWFVFLHGRVSWWTSVIVCLCVWFLLLVQTGTKWHQTPRHRAATHNSYMCVIPTSLCSCASFSPTDGLMLFLLTTTLVCVHMFLALWLHLAKWPLKLQPVFHPTVQLGYIKPDFPMQLRTAKKPKSVSTNHKKYDVQ